MAYSKNVVGEKLSIIRIRYSKDKMSNLLDLFIVEVIFCRRYNNNATEYKNDRISKYLSWLKL